MSLYTVMVNDNFHYMDEDERWQLGTFATAEEALAACRKLVEESLLESHRPGMTAKELYDRYTSFGDDPFIIAAEGAAKVEFSAWNYAQIRAVELCEDAARTPSGGTDGHT